MNGLPEAIARVPPAPYGSGVVNASQSTALAAGVAHAAVEVPGMVASSPLETAGGCWITWVWMPTVADEVVRMCFGGSDVEAVATDRAFMPGVEEDYWLPIGFTHWSGLSAGGGELSWHRSSR